MKQRSAMEDDEISGIFEPTTPPLVSQYLGCLGFGPFSDSAFDSYDAQPPATIDPSVLSISSAPSLTSVLDPASLSSLPVLPRDSSHLLVSPNSVNVAVERPMQGLYASSMNSLGILPTADAFIEDPMDICEPAESVVLPVHPFPSPSDVSTLPSSVPLQHGPSEVSNVRSNNISLPIRQRNYKAALVCGAWIDEHLHNPYATLNEKIALAAAAGTSVQQVATRLANARKRDPRLQPSKSSLTGWEDKTYEDDRGRRSSCSTTSSWRESSCESAQTSFSATSESLPSEEPKRGRKRKYGHDVLSNHQRKLSNSRSSNAMIHENSKPVFQCTFCREHLSRRAWRRHEETKHRPTIWTCMETGPVVDLIDGSTRRWKRTCAFCGSEVGGNGCPNRRQHRIDECKSEKRQFNRKDKLKQHFRNFHHTQFFSDEIADRWKTRPPDANTTWPCGFCPDVLTGWHLRETHIEKHFLDGMTMESWQIPENKCSESAPSAIQADHHVRYLVQQGIVFQCPPKDDDTGPHSHCFHSRSFTTGINSKYFPGCESIRLGLSRYIDDSFTKYHIWTCGNKADLVLSMEGTSGTTYWLRCSTDTLTIEQPSSIFKEQVLARLRLDDKPDSFYQKSDRDIILGSNLDWPHSRTFSILLKFNGTENFNALPAALSHRRGKVVQKSNTLMSWDFSEYLPQDKLTGKFFKTAAIPYNDQLNDDRSETLEGVTEVDDDQYHDTKFPYTEQYVDDMDISTLIDESYSISEAENDGQILTPSASISRHSSRSPPRLSQGQTQSTLIHENLLREYTCGDPTYRGQHWGCLKQFKGRNGIADHLRSGHGTKCKSNLLWLQEHFAISSTPIDQNGLPIALFEIYPGLEFIDFNSLKEWDDLDSDGEDGEGYGRSLSVIWSVSTHSKSSRVTAVLRTETFGQELHGPRPEQPEG